MVDMTQNDKNLKIEKNNNKSQLIFFSSLNLKIKVTNRSLNICQME